jgi:hemoglobin/transferrin/lactoferrin receptor protein
MQGLNMAFDSARVRAFAGGVSFFAIAASGCIAPASAQTTLLDAITIIATKTEEIAIEALAPVSTIREQQIQQLQPTRPNQIFFGIPGVTSEATAQDASTAINIRGLQDFGRVAVLIDGARQNYARLGHDGAGSFFLEPEILADADIVRGPTANIYGSGAIGGVVALRTKDVEDILKPGQLWGIQTNGTVGTNGFDGVGSIFAASRISPNAEIIIGGSLRSQSDYSDGNGTRIVNSGQEVQTALAKATFRPADGHQIKLGATVYNAEWTNGTPPTSSAIRDFQSTNLTTTASYKFKPVSNPLIDFDATVYWNRVEVDSTLTALLNPTPTNMGIFGPVGTRTNYLIDTYGFDLNNTSRFEFAGMRHALTYGADYFTDDVKNSATAGFGAGYNPRGERTVSGGFVQLKSSYSSWLEVIGAVRYDNYSLDGINAFNNTQVSNGGDRFSPKITIGVTPWDGIQPYISYAEGYRAPAVTETLVSGQHPGASIFSRFLFIPNPNLRPEVGKNTEIGINIKRDNLFVAGDKFRLKANLFENHVDDFIDTAFLTISGAPGSACPIVIGGFPPGPLFVNCAQYQNIAEARIRGFELESFYDRGDYFFGLAGHVIRGKDLTTGAPLAKIPPAMVATTIGARFLDQKLTLAVRWAAIAAKKPEDLPPGTNAFLAVGSYNLVNLYVGYQIDPTLLAALSVENLLDEPYTVYTHELASPGVTVKFSIRKLFGPQPEVPPLAANNAAAAVRPAAAR